MLLDASIFNELPGEGDQDSDVPLGDLQRTQPLGGLDGKQYGAFRRDRRSSQRSVRAGDSDASRTADAGVLAVHLLRRDDDEGGGSARNETAPHDVLAGLGESQKLAAPADTDPGSVSSPQGGAGFF
jgi:hypothetical protein